MFSICTIAPVTGWNQHKPPPGIPLQREHQLVRTLHLFFPFSEGSGRVVNDIASGKTGIIQNTSWPDWTTRRGSLRLDGVDDRIDLFSMPIVRPSQPFTLAMRLVIYNLSNVGYLFIVHNNLETYYCYAFCVDTLRRFIFIWDASSSPISLVTNETITLNVPFTAALTWTGGTGAAADETKIYLNGQPTTYASASGNGANLYGANIGRWSIGGRVYDNTRNVNGAFDWFMRWNRVLSRDEIYRLHVYGPWQLLTPSTLIVPEEEKPSSILQPTIKETLYV